MVFAENWQYMKPYLFHSIIFFLVVAILHVCDVQVITFSPQSVWWICLSYFSVLLYTAVIDLLTRGKYLSKLRYPLNITYLIIYLFVYVCHHRAKEALNFSLIGDNISLLVYRESVDVVNDSFKWRDYVVFILGLATIFYVSYKKEIYSSYLKLKLLIPSTMGLATLLFFNPYNYYDEVGYFVKTIWMYYQPTPINERVAKILEENPFPYKKNEKLAFPRDKPFIFLVPIEAFNANFADATTDDGRPFTPIYNSLIPKGRFIENYYGNSIQTSKSKFTILCGLTPLTTRKVATHYPNQNFHCLPKILKDLGYQSFYFQGHQQPNFDNTFPFMSHLGFDVVEHVDINKMTDEEKATKIWGWGPQDDILYRQSFERLDELTGKDSKKPYFVMLPGVSSHRTFCKLPPAERGLYPSQFTRKQCYANAINAADRYLDTFFTELNKRDYLKNSIIILTGDHSHTAGERGFVSNERSFYNEFFKTPFLILWEGKIKPFRDRETRASHLDLGPTILDLIGARSPNHFVGKSVFAKDKSRDMVPLVQPYVGVYIGFIDGKYKFIKHLRTGQKILFNLDEDPYEFNNLGEKKEYQEHVKKYDQALDIFYLNDYVIKNNRIW